MIGGLTKCLKVFDVSQVKSGLSGLLVGQLVLLRGQGGDPAIPHADNGVWAVAVGSWTRVEWGSGTRSPHVQVGDPATSDGGDPSHGLYRLESRTGGKVEVKRL